MLHFQSVAVNLREGIRLSVTLQEVAEHLGVSRMAVSYALRDQGKISLDMRRRIATAGANLRKLLWRLPCAGPIRLLVSVLRRLRTRVHQQTTRHPFPPLTFAA